MRMIDACMLCDWFASTKIITQGDVRSHAHTFKMYRPEEEILIKVANQLLSGNTSVLYIMFETLQNNSDIFHDLVSEIQVALDQKLQTGM